ncbi:hypothetical protein EMCG_06112 [[Emmonsia] crescens]|uniref:Uncharacterized protein n=1 Tax=[Emmonsia] crescens TaxID=73230 RepID=A0A0G2JBX1_9EURO|nr:hypothetical protein EMCG_06112 [Emmonsia crescens UAMH 3008]
MGIDGCEERSSPAAVDFVARRNICSGVNEKLENGNLMMLSRDEECSLSEVAERRDVHSTVNKQLGNICTAVVSSAV